jgi:hypothetical protein
MLKELALSRAKHAFFMAWDLSSRVMERFESPSELGGTERIRVAFVKSSAYVDFYSDPDAKTAAELIASTNWQPGPVALFTKMGADFFMVQPEPDAECVIWEKKVASRGEPESHRLAREKQAPLAIPADSVDWSQYDLVFAMENAVPARITRKYPKVLWATMLEDHRVAEFAAYQKAAPGGYDLVFNEHFGPTPRSWKRRPHVIEWPYALNYQSSIIDLHPNTKKEDALMIQGFQPSDAFTDIESDPRMTVYWAKNRLNRDHLAVLVRCKVFFSPIYVLPRWGNALVEAAAADCVCVGNRTNYWNPSLIEPELHCSSLETGLPIVERLLFDADYHQEMLRRQRQRLNWYAFHRPWTQVANFVRRSPRALNIKKRI